MNLYDFFVSFPYLHIFPIFPYSPISIYFICSCIRISIGSAGCPATCVFSFFIFVAWGRGVFFLWFFDVGVVDGFRSVLRLASRFAFRLVSSFTPFRPSARFPVSLFAPFSVPPFCSFLRLGVSGGRFVGRAIFVSSLGAGGRLFFFVS